VTVKNELQSKESVLIFLRTASIPLEGVRKAEKDFIQNSIFLRAKYEAANLTPQLLRSEKPIFIFTSYAGIFTYESKKARLIERLMEGICLRLKGREIGVCSHLHAMVIAGFKKLKQRESI
jgi:hypothetical protein